MLKHLLSTTAAIGAVAFAGTALAQSETRSYCDEGFVVADTNEDGMISEEELSTVRNAEFSDLDANGDGQVSQSEYTECLGAWAENAVTEPVTQDEIAEFDEDGDGMLTADEFMGGAEASSSMRMDEGSVQSTSTDGSESAGGMADGQVLVLRRIVLVPQSYSDQRVVGMTDEEMSARAGQRFQATDTDMDNTLSSEEIMSSDETEYRARLKEMIRETFSALDTDQSGDISEMEYINAGIDGWEKAKLMAEQKGVSQTENGAPVVYFRYPSTM